MVRAFALHAKCRRFESVIAHQNFRFNSLIIKISAGFLFALLFGDGSNMKISRMPHEISTVSGIKFDDHPDESVRSGQFVSAGR